MHAGVKFLIKSFASIRDPKLKFGNDFNILRPDFVKFDALRTPTGNVLRYSKKLKVILLVR